jgi:hypothetical protein
MPSKVVTSDRENTASPAPTSACLAGTPLMGQAVLNAKGAEDICHAVKTTHGDEREGISSNRTNDAPEAMAQPHPWGWTPERRARQAAAIHDWQPWRRATGPRTMEGKAAASRNAAKPHSLRRQLMELIDELKQLLRLLKKIEVARRRSG